MAAPGVKDSVPKASDLITLLTDFGTRDHFVGTMKGVILSINPEARIVDISHDISPGDIRAAAFVLAQAYPYFPPGTIHVVVVDPGVGSSRRAIAARTPNGYFIAPDNGVLAWVFSCHRDCDVVALTQPRFHRPHVSRTFHGRDIFCPVAAHLSRGVPFEELGPKIVDFDAGTVEQPKKHGNILRGRVIYVDRFGNLVTNVPHEALERRPLVSVRVGPLVIDRLSESYAERAAGEPLAILGSHGFLEIAARDDNAAQKWRLSRDMPVEIAFQSESTI